MIASTKPKHFETEAAALWCGAQSPWNVIDEDIQNHSKFKSVCFSMLFLRSLVKRLSLLFFLVSKASGKVTAGEQAVQANDTDMYQQH